MASVNGKIEAISIKDMPQPDNYGNTFRASLKIGEDWYSYGQIKRDAINVKNGSDWVQLAKGMDVEFMFVQNGDFRNIKKASFSITDASGAQAPQAPRPPQSTQSTQGAGTSKSFVNPAEIGQCLNLAAEVLKLDGKQLLDDKEVTKAIQWYKAVREKFNELYVGVEVPKVEVKKAKPTPVPKEEPVLEYDDELEF